MDKIYYITELQCIVEQMKVGAGRLAKLIVYVSILVGIIGLFFLLFKSGIIPNIDFKTAKNAGGMIKTIPAVWM